MTAAVADPDLAALRRHFRQQRLGLSGEQRAAAASAVVERLEALLASLAGPIGSYMATGSEIDPAPWMRRARARGAELWLPVVQTAGAALVFRPWSDDPDHWQRNTHGIAEPRLGPSLPAAALSALVIPLLAFDVHGTRLGAGGGYYDRSLADCPGPRPLRVGLAFDCQRAEQLPRRPWDAPLDHIVTETESLTCPRS
ncbi:MAG: 5-formyltetrahydrofolate cyclo-ligase [Xanthomonadales bacterium]|nr:5-formyltetrahydrofolate cyclo-ligase [Xanthomonadales bacterium]